MWCSHLSSCNYYALKKTVDYKVVRASTGSVSPLRNIPPPEQNTETRGTNIKRGPFVRAERGKDDITENGTEGD